MRFTRPDTLAKSDSAEMGWHPAFLLKALLPGLHGN